MKIPDIMMIDETNVNDYIFLTYLLPFLNEEITFIIEEKISYLIIPNVKGNLQ